MDRPLINSCLGPYPPLEGILDCENAGFVGYDPRSGMSPFANHNDEVEHGHHRNPIGHQPQAPLGQDEYSRGIDLSLDDINQSFYYDNPLVSHDRPWSNAFGSTFQQPLSPPATSMVNRDHDYHFQMGHVAHDRDDSPFRIKMEPHGGMIQGSYPPLEESTPGLPSPSMWPPQHYGSPAPRADLGPGPFALQDLNSPAI